MPVSPIGDVAERRKLVLLGKGTLLTSSPRNHFPFPAPGPVAGRVGEEVETALEREFETYQNRPAGNTASDVTDCPNGCSKEWPFGET